jgi:hypothetical protein
MRVVKLNTGKEITLRESPAELPINRFTIHQKYLIQAAGIGSTVGDVDRHFNTLDRFLAAGKIAEAAQERYNLHINLFLALNEINITHLAFAVLVDSVAGQPVSDYSEAGLKRIAEQLGQAGLTESELREILSDVKKNSILL